MAPELIKYIVIVVTGGILSVGLMVFAILTIRQSNGGKYYILGTAASAIFTLAYACELAASGSFEQMRFWLRIEYIAIPLLPVFILLMCLDYVGIKTNSWFRKGLYLIPFFTIILHNTNEYHYLYYQKMGIRTDSAFSVLDLVGGPGFFVQTIFLYACLVASIVILMRPWKSLSTRFKAQTIAMVAGLLTPTVASVFYVYGVSPNGIDLGPVFMSVSFIFHGVALVWFQMFHVAPIAREKVFESMSDGVMVLDIDHKLVDYNHSVRRIFPLIDQHSIGKPVESVFEHRPSFVDILLKGEDADYKCTIYDTVYYFYIRFSSVVNKHQRKVGQVITCIDVTERVRLQQQLYETASTDGLTSVFNRTYFIESMQSCLRALAPETLVATIMLDIDFFKQINDLHGHFGGDEVLKEIGSLLRHEMRNDDLLGRFGGEEFIIFLPNTDLEEARAIAEELRKHVEQRVITFDQRSIAVTASFGVSSNRIPFHEKDEMLTSLLRQADDALYAAKKHGRNQVQVYQVEMSMI